MENYAPVFESKIKKLRDKVIKELAVPKKARNKKRLKRMLKEINGIKKTIRSAKRINTCLAASPSGTRNKAHKPSGQAPRGRSEGQRPLVERAMQALWGSSL